MRKRVGLYNLEPDIVNTAMMQVSTYHKRRKDLVELYSPLLHDEYDLVYAFSLFDYTDKSLIRPDMICGGTGFKDDMSRALPSAISDCPLDWSLYKDCDFSIIRFSLGCIRNCPFCIVREKEGLIRPVRPKNLNPLGTWIIVTDNNFFANPFWEQSIQQLRKWNQPVDIQGVDVRLLTDVQCESLLTLQHKKQIKIAWDNPEEDITPHLDQVTKILRPYRLMCYVLIGFNSTEAQDLHRVETLRKYKIDPFVMPFDKSNEYQRKFARWCNHKAIWRKVKWEDYDPGASRRLFREKKESISAAKNLSLSI